MPVGEAFLPVRKWRQSPRDGGADWIDDAGLALFCSTARGSRPRPFRF
jgi:hypothetical protein